MFRDILIPKGLGSRKQVSNLRKNTTNSMFSFHIITHFLLSLLIFSLAILITVIYRGYYTAARKTQHFLGLNKTCFGIPNERMLKQRYLN